MASKTDVYGASLLFYDTHVKWTPPAELVFVGPDNFGASPQSFIYSVMP
jgi:hypothetical protein